MDHHLHDEHQAERPVLTNESTTAKLAAWNATRSAAAGYPVPATFVHVGASTNAPALFDRVVLGNVGLTDADRSEHAFIKSEIDGARNRASSEAEGFALVDVQREDSVKSVQELKKGDHQDFDCLVLELKDSSRRRTRKRKIAAARTLRGLSPVAGDGKHRGRSFTVCICGKFSRNDKGGDLIVEATAAGKTSVGNAQFCASAWTCADCVMHLGVTRGTYVEKATAALREAGYRVVMTTMTVPHKLRESCNAVFDRLKAAHARLDADGSYRLRMKKLGYIGRIRVVEVTHGASGWHVHSHELMVFVGPDGKTSAKQDNVWASNMQANVFPIWDRIIVAVSGQHASKDHGFTVVPVWSNSDYVAKLPEHAKKRDAEDDARKAAGEKPKPRWGAQAELTKAHVKKAEKGGRTPWDILDGCYAGIAADIILFRDYARGTWNRTQFETTKGLRELLASFDISIAADLEIIREAPDFVFVDELEEDGDQSNIVIERVLIDRDSQSSAHLHAPSWLENVRHDVELNITLTLIDAMRSNGFEIELVSAGRFVNKTTNVNAGQGADFDKDDATIDAHYEPSIYRATFVPMPEPSID